MDKETETEMKVTSEEAPKQLSLFKFFTYITFYDKLLLVFGTISAILAGAILPSVSLIMGNVADAFTSGGSGGTDIISNMSFIASYVVLIATTLFTFSYLFFAFWQHLAENIVTDLRLRYIRALMR
jgi:ATP-binding cassette subfamily B (MDR/TAP) protein 1